MMEISSAVLSTPPSSTLGQANVNLQQTVALRMLKQSIDLQGQLALSLLPQPPSVDPSSPLGQSINIHV